MPSQVCMIHLCVCVDACVNTSVCVCGSVYGNCEHVCTIIESTCVCARAGDSVSAKVLCFSVCQFLFTLYD